MGPRSIHVVCVVKSTSKLSLMYSAVFHTEGGVPWDFPPLAQLSPSSFADSTVYFVLFSHPKWDQVLHLLVLKTMILYETLH